MLQFLTHSSDKYSIAEEAQMAIEGGCGWIQVTKSVNDGEDFRQTIIELKPLCEENGTFLMIDSDVELANELRIHGVHLRRGDMSPGDARQQLGPHAVIGVDCDNAHEILTLKGLDIDYASVGPYREKFAEEDYRQIIAKVRELGFEIPVVAYGEISLEEVKPLLEAGVNGFAISQPITNAADPVKKTQEYLAEMGAPSQSNANNNDKA